MAYKGERNTEFIRARGWHITLPRIPAEGIRHIAPNGRLMIAPTGHEFKMNRPNARLAKTIIHFE